MSDPFRQAVERALKVAERVKQEHLGHLRESDEIIRELKAALDVPSAPMIPLSEAAWLLGISDGAARQRAKRGAGEKRGGRWFFPAHYVDARAKRKLYKTT